MTLGGVTRDSTVLESTAVEPAPVTQVPQTQPVMAAASATASIPSNMEKYLPDYYLPPPANSPVRTRAAEFRERPEKESTHALELKSELEFRRLELEHERDK